jgi:hypothetical protein
MKFDNITLASRLKRHFFIGASRYVAAAMDMGLWPTQHFELWYLTGNEMIPIH